MNNILIALFAMPVAALALLAYDFVVQGIFQNVEVGDE